eukprot:scaffold5221_cov397-Prasinococcus_capsulatus_cf.AAC.8
MQGRSAAAEKRRAELTVQELQAMPQETKTFLNVGKMYVLRPKTEIEESVRRTHRVQQRCALIAVWDRHCVSLVYV